MPSEILFLASALIVRLFDVADVAVDAVCIPFVPTLVILPL